MPDFLDFPASTATVDAFSGEVLSYEAAGELAASGSVLGEALAAAEVAAVAAAAAEPLLIIGAGLGAVALADAVWNKLHPSTPKPEYDTNRRSGGRIGGNVFVEFKFKLKTDPVVLTGTTSGNSPFRGIFNRPASGGQRLVGFSFGNGDQGAYQAADNQVDVPLTIVNVTTSGGTPPDHIIQPNWINPGTGTLPTPTPVDILLPSGDTFPITPTVYPSQRAQPGLQPAQRVSPGILVFVPEIGVAINFSPNNVTIVYTTPADSPTVYYPPPSTVAPIKYPTDPCNCPPENNTEVLCRIKQLETKLLDDGYDYTTHILSTADSGTITGTPDELYAVRLNITPPTVGAKTQYGNANAPEIVFSGWLSFIAANGQLPRDPIQYAAQAFLAPSLATGFSYTITLGGTASGSYITRKKRPYVDQC